MVNRLPNRAVTVHALSSSKCRGSTQGLKDSRTQGLEKSGTRGFKEMSRRDGAIVAWHEVPGDSVTPTEPSRRVRYDSRRCLATGLWRIQRWYHAGTVDYLEPQLEHHRLRSVLSLRDALADISQQHLLEWNIVWLGVEVRVARFGSGGGSRGSGTTARSGTG